MKTNRLFALCSFALLALAAAAQSPEAIRESLAKYPKLTNPTHATYPSIPLGEVAAAPEGFEPFYFTMVGRHGSRYEQSATRFRKAVAIFSKADSLDILTPDGKLLLERSDAVADMTAVLLELGFARTSCADRTAKAGKLLTVSR